jgi:hypothetical protein
MLNGTAAAQQAIQQIEIIEYAPQETTFYSGELSFYQNFDIRNTSASDTQPKIQLTINDFPMANSPLLGLTHIRLADADQPDNYIEFTGIAEPGYQLMFDETGTIYLNSVRSDHKMTQGALNLPQESTTSWQFTADLVLKDSNGQANPQPGHVGVFDDTQFDQMAFDSITNTTYDEADHQLANKRTETVHFGFDDPVVEINVLAQELTPGSFLVVVPWHVPGFTDQFAENNEHPRQLLKSMLQLVKAAGIEAEISYRQEFSESHDLNNELHLVVVGDMLSEQHPTENSDVQIHGQQNNHEVQEISDEIIFTGVFDCTPFDHPIHKLA